MTTNAPKTLEAKIERLVREDSLSLQLARKSGADHFSHRGFRDGRSKRNGSRLSDVNAADALRLTMLLIAAHRLDEYKEDHSALLPSHMTGR
ncbi:hypothetical protein [Myxococcus sp. AB036A]|uniref:hypothetical protein n=1 Tax=Myxococcus sp. AB036A TaxID=2562793 RepID=UPI0011465749|nr:hypothetical protein [Myxococcus sp. AB036A]